jgi:predicted transcriptional regulator
MSTVQLANSNIKQAILDGMTPGQLYTIQELHDSIPAAAELSNQRVSALVRQLCADGLVIRTEDKRLAYFSLAE